MSGLSLEGRIIGVDWDGCIASGAGLKVTLAREMFGLQITVEQTAEDAFSMLHGKETYRRMMDLAGKRIDEYELLPYGREVITLLQEEGAMTVVITSRTDDEAKVARAFNLRNRVPIHDIYNTRRQSKRAVILQLKPAAYIDDSLWKLAELEGTGTALYFLKQDWNRHEHEAAMEKERKGTLAVTDGWQRFYSQLTGKAFLSEAVK